jgi:biopolymer transport protein ExbD
MTLERRLKPDFTIDMTPLIDVVFQLVIFFMITTTFKVTPGIRLDLPNSSTSESVPLTEIRIVAVSEKEIYLNKQQTTLEGLPVLLSKAVAGHNPAEMRAILEGESSTSYQLMVSVLDALRKNGIEGVGLATKSTKSSPATKGPQ